MTQDVKPRPISTIGRMIELLKQLEVDISKLYVRVIIKSDDKTVHAHRSSKRICSKARGAYGREDVLPLDEIWEREKKGEICLFCSSHHRATGKDHAFWDSPNKLSKLLSGGLEFLEADNIKDLKSFKSLQEVLDFKLQLTARKEEFVKLDLREDEIGKIADIINKFTDAQEAYLQAIRNDPKFSDWVRAEIRKSQTFLGELPEYLKLAEQAESIRAQYRELEAQTLKFHATHYCIRPKPRRISYHTDLEQAIMDCWGKYSNIIMLPLDVDTALGRWYGDNNHDDTLIFDSEPLPEHLEALDVFFNPNNSESVLSLREAYEAAKAV